MLQKNTCVFAVIVRCMCNGRMHNFAHAPQCGFILSEEIKNFVFIIGCVSYHQVRNGLSQSQQFMYINRHNLVALMNVVGRFFNTSILSLDVRLNTANQMFILIRLHSSIRDIGNKLVRTRKWLMPLKNVNIIFLPCSDERAFVVVSALKCE